MVKIERREKVTEREEVIEEVDKLIESNKGDFATFMHIGERVEICEMFRERLVRCEVKERKQVRFKQELLKQWRIWFRDTIRHGLSIIKTNEIL